MNTLLKKYLAAGTVALGLFAALASAQNSTPITYVDATHGGGGNTTMLDGIVWNPETVANDAGGVWVIRSTFGNGGIVYQSPTQSDGHRVVTSVSGLPENTYNVYAFFWSDGSSWRIRASLTNDAELPLYIRTDEGVVRYYFGGDARVFSSALDGENPFTTDVMVAEGNRRLFQAYLGTVTGTEFSVFIDDDTATGAGNRTWYDGIGYAVIGAPPPVEFPLAADFGSVRFVNIRDDIGAGHAQIGVAEEGALPFIDEQIAITSLPPLLAGKVALRTANTQATWRFDEEPVTVEWTYVDAIPDLDPSGVPLAGANTTLASGSGQFQPLAGSGGAEGWVVRSPFGNIVGDSPSVLQAFGPAGSGGPNAPELKTTIRDLEPGKVYPVTAMFWHDPSPWGLRAGFEYGNDLHENELYNPSHPAALDATAFKWATPGVLTAEGNRLMKAAFLGHIAADTNGEINVFVHDQPTDSAAFRTWYDGIAVGSDVFKPSGTYLAFEVDRDTTMYVINHPASRPAWLTSSFSLTGMTVETTAGTFEVWQRAVAARELVVLPGNGGDLSDLNYWVVLGESPDAITPRPDGLFRLLPSSDWSVGKYFRQAASGLDEDFHTASMLATVTNFTPEIGFRLTSTLRVPRLQEEGDNSFGYLLLGGGAAPIRAEWLPRASGGGSLLRFVDTSNGSTLAQGPWTGLVPTKIDNDVGVGAGAVETLFSVGALVFVDDAESVVFSEDFETGGNGWTTGANNAAVDQWEIGTPTSGPGTAFNGSNVAATNLAGHYTSGSVPDTVAWLRSPEIDLRGMGSATLRFHEFLDVDTFELNGDIFHFGTVRVLNADTLALVAELAKYNTQIFSWTERVLDLSGVTGNRVVIEFALHTDHEEYAGNGWYIDAVEVTGTGLEITSLPERLTLDGTLNGISTERAGVADASANHLQFTIADRGGSGNAGATVYVAWDVRASGLEPNWLTQDFVRTDHFVGVGAGFHRLWAREFADGAQVTLGGASAAGPGATGLPFGTNNYFVLFGDARPGLETFYTLEASGEWTDGQGALTLKLTDANGFSQSVQTTVTGDFTDRKEFGMAARHPAGASAPVWELFILTLDGFEEIVLPEGGFQAWREEHFAGQLDNPDVSGPHAAPAGDGVPNLLKYALGLSPWVPAAAGDLPYALADGEHILVLVYTERTDIDDILYIPEMTEDLTMPWQSGEPHVIEIFREAGASPNTMEVGVRGAFPAEADKGLLRLKVQLLE